MGLSERFELIHAKEKRAAGTAQHGSRGGRPDKRTRAKLARKATLASAMSGRMGRAAKTSEEWAAEHVLGEACVKRSSRRSWSRV